MEKLTEFQCFRTEHGEDLTADLISVAGTGFVLPYTERKAMALVAEMKKTHAKDCLCRIPFCVTVEAEAFGGAVTIPDDGAAPKMDGYLYDSLEQLANIREMDLDHGRISEVLGSAKILRQSGQFVVLNIMGPMTVLGLLIDNMLLYRGIHNHRELVERALSVVEDGLVQYILAAVNLGVEVISYADPAGQMEIVGPKVYEQISGRSTYRILKRVEGKLTGTIIHLCSRTSLSLEKGQFCAAG